MNDDLLRRLFQYARESRGGPAVGARTAVHSQFYERLFEDEVARLSFRRHLTETEFLELEPTFARRFGSSELAEIRSMFYEARLALDGGTTLGAARRIKDDLLDAVAPEVAEHVRQAWAMSLPLLEVHEDVIGLEIFLDNISNLAAPIRGELKSCLSELLERTRARVSAGNEGVMG
jgi:hypothetical protein